MNKSYIVMGILLILASSFLVVANTPVVDLKDWVKVEIVSPLEENGAIPINIQDQTSRPFDIRVNQIISSAYSLTAVPTINTYDLTLNTTSGLAVGDSIAFLEQNGMPQLLFGEILAININTITLDTLIPWNFTPANTTVFEFNSDLSIDGSTTEQIFTITNFFAEEIDIVRFVFHCTDNVVMDDEKFCGLTKLTRGLVLRKQLQNGNYINYFNVKTNGEWAELAFDKSYDDKAPAGFYGFSTRLTYGGQSKHGVVIRLAPGESIQLIVQDDLTGLEKGGLMVEGHFVQN